MWQIILLQPEKEIFGFLWLMAINYFTLIIILLLPIIVFSFLISKKIMKPLKEEYSWVGWRGTFSGANEVGWEKITPNTESVGLP